MLKTRIDRSEGGSTLVLEGDLIIDHAEELRQGLILALESGNSLAVHAGNIDRADLFGLQVLCSAHQAAELSQKMLTFTGRLPKALIDTIERSRFGSHAGCSAGAVCPWDSSTVSSKRSL